MKYVVMIQARCGSTRLPNKVLKPLCGKPALQRMIERVQRSSLVDEVMVITSINKENLPILALCADLGVRCGVGAEDDVLDRYYQTAKLLKPEYVIRLTADCPCFDAELLDLALSQMEPDADYVLVIAGHNDACKIGDSKDSAEMFRDSMEVLIANIRTQCPNAKIGFVTPWYVPRLGFDLTCKVMKQVCDKHYVPVLWNHSKNNVIQVRDASFRSQYFQDPKDFAHLNAKGHDLYLPTATAWFKKYMMNNKRKMK